MNEILTFKQKVQKLSCSVDGHEDQDIVLICAYKGCQALHRSVCVLCAQTCHSDHSEHLLNIPQVQKFLNDQNTYQSPGQPWFHKVRTLINEKLKLIEDITNQQKSPLIILQSFNQLENLNLQHLNEIGLIIGNKTTVKEQNILIDFTDMQQSFDKNLVDILTNIDFLIKMLGDTEQKEYEKQNKLTLNNRSLNIQHEALQTRFCLYENCVLLGNKGLFDNCPNQDSIKHIIVKKQVLQAFYKQVNEDTKLLEEKLDAFQSGLHNLVDIMKRQIKEHFVGINLINDLSILLNHQMNNDDEVLHKAALKIVKNTEIKNGEFVYDKKQFQIIYLFIDQTFNMIQTAYSQLMKEVIQQTKINSLVQRLEPLFPFQ